MQREAWTCCWRSSAVHPLSTLAWLASPPHHLPLTIHPHPTPAQVFNLGNPGAVYKSVESPLKYQTRCISCFPDKTGYLIGSIEGRVAVHHVEDNLQSKNFTFKCHRCGEWAGG